jgi:hypothetical protein
LPDPEAEKGAARASRARRASAILPVSLVSLFLVSLASPAAADDEPRVDPTGARPTLLWLLTQLIPSPEAAEGQGEWRFGLRWQVTPVLYSFGLDPRVSGWRALVVEPIVRQSGSIEVFFTPELFTGMFDTPLLRGGVRSYFPLVAKGEELSVSLGTSYAYMNGQRGVGFELGAYVLYGTIGVQVTYTPAPAAVLPATAVLPPEWITTLRIRYF